MRPIFRECRDRLATDDPYWYQVFDDLYHDKPPRGVRFSDRELFSMVKGKEFNINYVDNDAETVYETVKDTFSRLLGYQSPTERDNLLGDNVYEKLEEWTDTKKKSVRDALILEFVSRMGKEHNLNLQQKKKLYFTINSGMVFKTICSADFNMSDGKIESIDDLVFSEGNFTLNRNISTGRRTYKPTSKLVREEIEADDGEE